MLAFEEKLESGRNRRDERSGDDNLSVNELPVKGRVFTLLIRSSN